MTNIKEIVYNTLKVYEGATVLQTRPEVLQEFPCVTFHILSGIPAYTLAHGIGVVETTVAIDIYAHTSTETTQILEDIEELMRDKSLTLEFFMDVPEDNLSHVTSRFNLIK